MWFLFLFRTRVFRELVAAGGELGFFDVRVSGSTRAGLVSRFRARFLLQWFQVLLRRFFLFDEGRDCLLRKAVTLVLAAIRRVTV